MYVQRQDYSPAAGIFNALDEDNVRRERAEEKAMRRREFELREKQAADAAKLRQMKIMQAQFNYDREREKEELRGKLISGNAGEMYPAARQLMAWGEDVSEPLAWAAEKVAADVENRVAAPAVKAAFHYGENAGGVTPVDNSGYRGGAVGFSDGQWDAISGIVSADAARAPLPGVQPPEAVGRADLAGGDIGQLAHAAAFDRAGVVGEDARRGAVERAGGAEQFMYPAAVENARAIGAKQKAEQKEAAVLSPEEAAILRANERKNPDKVEFISGQYPQHKIVGGKFVETIPGATKTPDGFPLTIKAGDGQEVYALLRDANGNAVMGADGKPVYQLLLNNPKAGGGKDGADSGADGGKAGDDDVFVYGHGSWQSDSGNRVDSGADYLNVVTQKHHNTYSAEEVADDLYGEFNVKGNDKLTKLLGKQNVAEGVAMYNLSTGLADVFENALKKNTSWVLDDGRAMSAQKYKIHGTLWTGSRRMLAGGISTGTDKAVVDALMGDHGDLFFEKIDAVIAAALHDARGEMQINEVVKVLRDEANQWKNIVDKETSVVGTGIGADIRHSRAFVNGKRIPKKIADELGSIFARKRFEDAWDFSGAEPARRAEGSGDARFDKYRAGAQGQLPVAEQPQPQPQPRSFNAAEDGVRADVLVKKGDNKFGVKGDVQGLVINKIPIGEIYDNAMEHIIGYDAQVDGDKWARDEYGDIQLERLRAEDGGGYRIKVEFTNKELDDNGDPVTVVGDGDDGFSGKGYVHLLSSLPKMAKIVLHANKGADRSVTLDWSSGEMSVIED